MGASFFPVFIVTAFWGVVGIVLPLFVPKSPNKGISMTSTLLLGAIHIVILFASSAILLNLKISTTILQLILMLTAATCWLFWLCCYMSQMNPLIGPKLHNKTIILMANTWGNPIKP